MDVYIVRNPPPRKFHDERDILRPLLR